MRAWGTQDAVNYLNNTYYDSEGTSVGVVTLAAGDLNGLQFSMGLVPAPTQASELVSLLTWPLGEVPYIGSLLQVVANDMNVASIVDDDPNNALWQQVTFNSPGTQYLLPVNTYADQFESYAEQFGFNANPGSGVQDAGYVEYQTLVYDPSTESDYFAYNGSGTATLNTVVENYNS